MIRTGILEPDAPIELLEGWLVKKMIKNPAHRVATRKTRLALERVVGPDWSVDTQEAITTNDSEPEPDVSVVWGDTTKLIHRHPRPGEVGLLVEIADSSLDRDRGPKRRAYAAAGIPVYWIVNLIDRCVEVFSEPSGQAAPPTYDVKQVFKEGDSVPLLLRGHEVGRIDVDEMLP